MRIGLFSSWQVRCGIADYSAALVEALRAQPGLAIDIAAYDRTPHPARDYAAWGQQLNQTDVAHIQHEYAFFNYLTPWGNRFRHLVRPITRPLVITRHVSFDGPLNVLGRGPRHQLRRFKWWLYQRGLGPYARYLNLDMFARADQVIVLTGRIKQHLEARGMPSDRIHVIPAGAPVIASHATPEDVAHIQQSLGLSGRKVIGQFGFVAPAKGHMLALQALATLPADHCYVVLGGARIPAHEGYVEALWTQARALGLADRIRVTGFVSNEALGAHLAACDAVVFPNTHADYSYSIVTAVAHACAPVIVSDLPGHREIAAQTGGLSRFASGDAAALAAAIQAVTAQPKDQAGLRAQAGQLARDYSWDAIARRTVAVYRLAAERAAKHNLR
jgi:glycosyltransferase involved in cell wall biosynthesis